MLGLSGTFEDKTSSLSWQLINPRSKQAARTGLIIVPGVRSAEGQPLL
jgi:hypothetical protein